jgi:hypothetical protein
MKLLYYHDVYTKAVILTCFIGFSFNVYRNNELNTMWVMKSTRLSSSTTLFTLCFEILTGF